MPCSKVDQACVVYFDNKTGIEEEWRWKSEGGSGDQYISTHDLEMLCMGPSFQHSDKDFTLFQHPTMEGVWGASGFFKVSTDSAEERFARMRSVAVFGSDLLFLRKLVPNLIQFACQLSNSECTHEAVSSFINSVDSESAPLKQVENRFQPLHCLEADMVKMSHRHVLQVWRAVVARRRVLIYSRKNAGLLCDFAVALMHVSGLLQSGVADSPRSNVLASGSEQDNSEFRGKTHTWMYRTVRELDDAKGSKSWIICTNDPIYIEEPLDNPLFDVLVKINENGKAVLTVKPGEELSGCASVTSADKELFDVINLEAEKRENAGIRRSMLAVLAKILSGISRPDRPLSAATDAMLKEHYGLMPAHRNWLRAVAEARGYQVPAGVENQPKRSAGWRHCMPCCGPKSDTVVAPL